MDIRHAARQLGGEVSGRNQVLCPGLGHSSQDRSLSVRFDPYAPGGFVVHSFSGDDPIRSRDFIRQRLGLPAWEPGDEQNRHTHSAKIRDFDRVAVDREAEPRPRTEDDLLRIARARELWDRALEPRGTAADRYLKSRALDLPPELADTVLRFHPRCPWRDENTGNLTHVAALLAVFRSVDNNEITAVHRIRVDRPERWPKTERKMLGIVHRAAIKLDALNGGGLTIGEGIETSLAARQLDPSLRPAWALGSVGAISFFPTLPGIKALSILAEAGKASADAIQICGRRWHKAGRRVRIIRPDVGSDLNDVLIANRGAK
jgi:Toprim domain